MHRLITASLAALTLAASAGAAVAQDFRALARQDLQFAHDQLQQNHPAAVIPGAASQPFQSWIDAGLADSLSKVGQVSSGDAHAYLMRYYATGFRDSNITLTPSFEGLGPFFGTSWAGVTTGWRGGKYVVTYVKPGTRGAPPLGAALVDCLGKTAEDLAKEKLDRWEADLTTEAGRTQSAPYLLWNRNNPFTSGVPAVCNFQVGTRRPREFTLRPIPVIPGDLEAAYRATVYVPGATKLSIETVNNRPWIHVHSFADDAGWEAFNAQLAAQAAAIRGPGGFVLDLRGADGRSYNPTARGYGLVNRIWTPEYTVSRQPSASDLTYRATPANRQWYAETLGRMQGDPYFAQGNPAAIAETQGIIAGMDAAIASGQQTFSLPGRPAANDTGAGNPVQGPVIVLIDGGCNTNCLYTVDLLSRLPNVRLAGSQTPTDTIFIEQTQLRVPSNYSDLSYGHKAWTSRQRASNQPFAPAQGLAYTGNPVDETAVRAWVGTLFGG